MVELLCDYPEWWRYNVYIMAVGFDADGENAVFTNLIDKVYDAAYGGAPRTMPADYKTPRVISLTTAPCAYADIYVYVVANTFPASEVIGDSPSFDAELRVSADGTCIDQSTWEVNQWGGLTIVARRVG
ncbi:hypothetical protein LJC45_05840 [Alistipes sp. OttesenSCG-928-B03]|nr:hypothetical protein [Alistipes sp. OttesenSCG-928-B03]